jgi:hypothetical protein
VRRSLARFAILVPALALAIAVADGVKWFAGQ